ncbi:MAG TPA: protease inhibitor I42 family protein [Dehalococcoidia bacterium]|nr:protease inhibitor I42 family protein [Dehalococcoidia bacterium]
MKIKLALLSVLAVASMVVTLLALSSDNISQAASDEEVGQVNIDTSYDGQEVVIDAGKLLVIELPSNPTTGFRWELSEPVDEDLITLVESNYEPVTESTTGIAGAGGTEVWTFKALTAGNATIAMEYSRPWEGGEKAVETFEVTVIIK